MDGIKLTLPEYEVIMSELDALYTEVQTAEDIMTDSGIEWPGEYYGTDTISNLVSIVESAYDRAAQEASAKEEG